MSWLAPVGAGIASFFAMEGVSYATHRWVMHGRGMRWHRSHHAPSSTGWEANDVFPGVFSAIGIGMFATASALHSPVLFASAAGVTAYGVAYLAVHDIYIHRRLGRPRVSADERRYLGWVHASHRMHHDMGGEPYGMLLPVVSARLRAEAERRAARRSST